MNTHIIKQWQGVFGNVIHKSESITDLLPGNDLKIEIALLNLGYEGIVNIQDISESALSDIDEAVITYQAKFAIRKYNSNALEQVKDADAIVGNHIIDDILSYNFCREKNLDPDMLLQDVEFSYKIWRDIANQKFCDSFELTRKVLDNAFESLHNNGYIILSSYQSRFEREHDFMHETRLCSRIMRELIVYSKSLQNISVIDAESFLMEKPAVYEEWLLIQRNREFIR